MRPPASLLALVGGLLLPVAAPLPAARADGGQNGSIVGTVFDPSGLPLAGIEIVAWSETEIGGPRATRSNQEGHFRFSALVPGKFELRASAARMKTVIVKNLPVGISTPAEVNVVMEVESATEEIAVVERPPLVETRSAALKEVIDLDTIQATPLAERNNPHEQLVGTVAGARGRLVRGGKLSQTLFLQDGFDMREQFPTMKSSAAYEILSGGHGAEAPTASGAAVNLVTRSGSNRREFELQATVDHSRLNLFLEPHEALAPNYRYVFNPTVAGPIIKDRLWYFADAETHLARENRVDDAAGLLAPRPPATTIINKGTLKLTWQVTPRNRLSSLTNLNFPREYNRNDAIGVEADAQERRLAQRIFSGLIWESVLSDTQVLRSQVGLTSYGEHIFPENCAGEPIGCDHLAPVHQSIPLDQQSVNGDRHSRNDTVDLQLINRFDWYLDSRRAGDHALTVRSNLFIEQETDRLSTPGDAVVTFNGPQPLRQTTVYANDPRLEPERFGWFIQSLSWRRHVGTVSDSWRPTRDLTLLLALSHVWAQAGNNRRGETVGAHGFAPSLALAWDATGDGRTVLRASFSNYADLEIETVGRHTFSAPVTQTCEWNPTSDAFDRNCFYEGGPSRNTIGLPCGPTGYDREGRDCRQPLQIPRTRELVLGAEREVVPGVALALDALYRGFTHQYDAHESNRVWNGNGTLLERTGAYRDGNHQSVSDLGTPAYARRSYLGATLGVRKREGRLKLQGSYTLARLVGAAVDYGDNPAQDPYLYGYLPDDHRHEIKALAQYQINRWVSTGLRYFYRSGVPYDRLTRNVVYGSFADNRAPLGFSPGTNVNDPGDDRPLRLPDLQSFNLQVRFNLQPLIHKRLDLFVDILNVLAQRTVVEVVESDGPAFGLPTDRQSPFHIRLGVNYRY